MKIRKAVIPVAGKGTRFLPATKQIPKEMIPILDKPMIHYAVEEAVNAGIEEVLFVTASGKETIENYFDRNMELEHFLENAGKSDLKEKIQKIGTMIEVASVRQKEQLGLGHAIACARSFVGNENFAVILGDDLVMSSIPVTGQLAEVSEAQNSASIIGVMEVPNKDTDKYGIIEGKYIKGSDKTLQMKSMVEKPSPSEAPTNLATPGRYILNKKIFDCLDEIPRGKGGEYQLTDAINLLATQESVFAHIFAGDRFDTGNVPSFLNATIEFALRDDRFSECMKNLIIEKASRLNEKS